ncbi:MAG: hypothetical protein ACR2KK_04690 [Acidimicrobiales bacterium]
MTEPAPPDPLEGPDDPSPARGRTVFFTALGAVLVAALLFAVLARVVSTRPATTGGAADGDGKRVVQFDLGRAEDFAPTIARSGPLLFPDPQGQSRDIFVQHLGGADWRAFEARATGTSRQCVLRWEQGARRFVDPCDGRSYPPDGAGLVSFPTRVNEKGRVIVDLGSPIPPAEAPAP